MANRTPEVGDIWTCGLYDWKLTEFVKAGTCAVTHHKNSPKGLKDHWHCESTSSNGVPTTSWNPAGIENEPAWTLKQAASSTTVAVSSLRPAGTPIQKKKRYQVSMDNKNWVRYDLLDDADPLESYKYHREL